MEDDEKDPQIRERITRLFEKLAEFSKRNSEAARGIQEIREGYTHQHEFLKWDRETYAKLYYPLWILFMGGFVFSLSTEKYHGSISPYLIVLIYVFRIVAIAGTGLNFWVQRLGLLILRYEWETERYLGQFQRKAPQLPNPRMPDDLNAAVNLLEESMKGQEEAKRAFEKADDWRRLSEKKDNTLQKLQVVLLGCTGSFLVLMLVLTWRIIP